MKILKNILLGIIILLAVLFVVSLFLPSKIFVQRSMVMNAPASTVFEQINVLKNWEKWSPWHKMDSNMLLTYDGPESGVGASYTWSSEMKNVGNGKLTLSGVWPNDSIITNLEFDGQNNAVSGYYLKEVEGGTELTITMKVDMGNNPFYKYMGLLLDKYIGEDYIKALNNIKTIVESEQKFSVIEMEAPEVKAISIRFKASITDVGEKFEIAYAELMDYLTKNNIKVKGALFSVAHAWSEVEGEFCDLEIAAPVSETDYANAKVTGDIAKLLIPPTKVACVDYYGPHEGTGIAHEAVGRWLEEKSMVVSGAPREIYITDFNASLTPQEFHTKIYYPIK